MREPLYHRYPELRFLLLIIMVWCTTVGYAQRIPFKYLTVEDGLSQNSVVSIAQDSLGFMWFATRNGLSRYDGYDFRVFESNPGDTLSLSSNVINSLEPESGTLLWIGTAQGLCLWDQRAGKIFRMNAWFEKDSLNGVYNIGDLHLDAHGDLWVMASGSGIQIFQRKKNETKFRKRLTLKDPPTIEGFYGQFMDDGDNLWIGTSRHGIWQFNRSTDSFAPLAASQRIENFAVSSLVKDRHGVPWIGTLNGLYKWNSSKESFDQVAGLNDAIVRSLYRDRDGRLWVGTDRGGLNGYNEETGSFDVYNQRSADDDGLLHNSVQSIYGDRQGILWLGTYAGGVNYYDRHLGVFHNYQTGIGDTYLNNNIITSFAEDDLGNLWVATDRGGLNFLDRRSNRFTYFRHVTDQPHSISTDIVQHISHTSDNGLLIGTWAGGLNRYDRQTGKFSHFIYNADDSTALVDNSINYVIEDSHGVVWAGTGHGLNVSLEKLPAVKHGSSITFRAYKNNPDVPNSLSNNHVTTIYEDKSGVLWVGTRTGLNQWDPASGGFFHVMNNPNNLALFTPHRINCIGEDDHGNFLLGTNENGLLVYDRIGNKLDTYNKQSGLPSNTVVGIQRGSNDDWWISTSNGLVRFNPNAKSFVIYNRYDGLPSNEFRSNASARLRNGELLFGGNNGFTRFHPDSIKTNRHPPRVSFTRFRLLNQVVGPAPNSVLKEDISVVNQITLSANQSSFGIDFIGINYTAPQKNTYAYRMEGIDDVWNYVGNQHTANYSYLPAGEYRFHVKAANSDGVWSDPISISITINPHWWNTNWFRSIALGFCLAAIWVLFKIRTHQLVMRKRTLEHTVKVRTLELEGKNQMLSEAKEELQMQTEEIQKQRDSIEEQLRTIQVLNEIGQKITAYLKKDELVTSIHSMINKFMDAPHLSIGNISADNESINFSTVRNIGSPIAEVSVSLSETDRISVASISKNQVIVIGNIDTEIDQILPVHSPRYKMPNSYRSAVYIPLMSTGGVVTQIFIVKNFQKNGFSTIHVEILKSLGAYIGIAYENAQVYKEIKVQSELLSKQTEQLKELNEIKSRFFINMSHEFRTPLTLIISPLEQLLEHQEEPDWSYVRHHLAIMDKNARQLLALINRLLDLRNVELKTDKPVLVSVDIVALLRNVMMQFEYLAERYVIHYRIITSEVKLFIPIDQEMMEKVFVNLYSNAFKYTPQGGSITTTIAVKSNGEFPTIEIQIADTGIGIEQKDIPFIFERFFQGHDPLHTLQEGTGLGLSLVKDFIELHSGTVSVTSEENKGTMFSIVLPYQSDAKHAPEPAVRYDDQQLDEHLENRQLPLLLLIDDNPGVLDFLTISFEGEFRTIRAENGKKGNDLAIQHIPDVIVSDVMMPVMDGIELCKRIKADPRTSHIPVVLLTAKTGENSQVTGLGVGADDYIPKPFKIKLLRARIQNIIATRKRLHELFSSHRNFEVGEFIENEHDKSFIERLDMILKHNIKNAAFNQEMLTREIGMSKTQLYRKLKALTGKTVHEYIRNYRLRVAHEIIRQSDMLIYEVAYEVGFSDPAYFSNSFNAYFGFWPKDLKKG